MYPTVLELIKKLDNEILRLHEDHPDRKGFIQVSLEEAQFLKDLLQFYQKAKM